MDGPDSLAFSINQAVNYREMIARASALGAKIRAEDGVAQAIQIIQSHIRKNT